MEIKITGPVAVQAAQADLAQAEMERRRRRRRRR